MTPAPYFRPIAVLNRVDARLAIWHVDVGPDSGLGRLSGAWVLDIERTAEIGTLINGRYTVDCVAGLELPAGVAAVGRLDLDAIVASVRAEIDSTDALFTEHIRGLSKSKQPVRPGWPTVVYPADTSALTRRVGALVGPALAAAHSLKDLAAVWFEFEALRVAREYLTGHGGPYVRSLPLIAQ